MTDIPPALRDDLTTYLLCSSPDRARIIAELVQRNPGMAEIFMDFEADDDPDTVGDRATDQPTSSKLTKTVA